MANFEGKVVAVVMELFDKKILRKGIELGRFEESYFI
jgi:hypothetical protein